MAGRRRRKGKRKEMPGGLKRGMPTLPPQLQALKHKRERKECQGTLEEEAVLPTLPRSCRLRSNTNVAKPCDA